MRLNSLFFLLLLPFCVEAQHSVWDKQSLSGKTSKGTLEENHYYPFGLAIYEPASNPVPNRYKYQGKEMQDELGLELYDFHARQYDPQIGRFWCKLPFKP